MGASTVREKPRRRSRKLPIHERRDLPQTPERMQPAGGLGENAMGAETETEWSAGIAGEEPIVDGVLDIEPDSYYGETSATLGDRIAAARQAARLTQAGLAARLGVGAKVVSAWENDRSEPRANRLTMLAGLLGVSVSWLLTGGGEGVDPPSAAAEAVSAPSRLSMSLETSDVTAARRFYGDLLGCALGAGDATRQTFAWFGHKLTLRAGTPSAAEPSEGAPADFEVVLEWDAWRSLIDRLRAGGAAFETEPTIRNVGATDENAMFRLTDPDGRSIEFSAFKDPARQEA